MRRPALLLLLALALGVPVLAGAARAEERITQFLSEVTVDADASTEVRETIEVAAEGIAIRHGIYRDLPTTYTDRFGRRVVTGFDLLSITRDGRPEPYALEGLANGTRIRIGDKDRLLAPGRHRYAIAYRTTRQLGFFPDFDELYWNVTGNGWTLPIAAARVTVRLPAGASVLQHSEYTGAAGEAGRDARVIPSSPGTYAAETTRRLERNEGFTIAVAWPKGFVAPPSEAARWRWWIADNAGLFVLALGTLLTLGYFGLTWHHAGRDPAKGTIIPLFTPPEGMGPAELRYVVRYGADAKGFAAALVGLAVKGRLGIRDDDGGYTITKRDGEGREPLTPSERALLAAVPEGSTELVQANHLRVRAMRNALEEALRSTYEGRAFLKNLGYFAGGLALSLASLIAGAALLPGEEAITALFALGWLGVWWAGILSTGWAAFRGVAAARGVWPRISSLAGLIVLVPFVGAGLAVPALLVTGGAASPALVTLLAAAALLGLMNVVFYHLLRAPTLQGRRLLDRIEGFRMYLATAEEERLRLLNPPEKTPDLFERYLPYALALDCENAWNAKFAAVLAAAAAAGAAAPAWYSGRDWSGGGGFAGHLGRSLAASAAAASAAPGRSSGAGGGGSSGGGGGGGGGGGW